MFLSRKTYLAFILLVTIASLCLFVFFLLSKESYQLNHVPYVGIYNHVGENSENKTDLDAMVQALVRSTRDERGIQWSELIERLTPFLLDGSTLSATNGVTLSDIEVFLMEKDYGPKISRIEISSLAEAIKEEKSPLLTFLPLTSDQDANINYYPAVLITGSDDWKKEVTLHSYWYGPERKISFEAFEILQERLPEGMRNKYLSLPSIDGGPEADLGGPEDYSLIVDSSGKENIIPILAISMWADSMYDTALMEEWFKRLVDHPEFSWLAPTYKVWALYRLGDIAVKRGDLEAAKQLTQQAIQLNKDLNEPSTGWPGFSVSSIDGSAAHDRISGPYRVLGDIYRIEGKLTEAQKAYNQALSIKPTNFFAIEGLALLEQVGFVE